MRKFYKIKSVVALALAMLANVAMGQTLKVTANGIPVSDGDVIDVKFGYEDYSEIIGYQYIYYIWNPNLEVSTTEGEETLFVTLSKVEDHPAFEICWPSQCIQYGSDGTASTSGTIGTVPTLVDIHLFGELTEKNPTIVDGGMSKVVLKCSSESIEFTLKALPADLNAVGENFADDNAPATYFTLEGIQIEKPSAKGMYIVKKGSKAKVMIRK